MNTQGSPITLTGYITSMSRKSGAHAASLALVQDNEEYLIIPRGAGVDLHDHVNAQAEIKGLISEEDGVKFLQVRGYRILEDDAWLDDA